MRDWPKTTVVILNWNGLPDTLECLQSLQAITYPNYEIVVVDNGSQGDDVSILRQRFGDTIHIIANQENLGFAGGCNIGIRHGLAGGADYLLLLNNDVVVEPQSLSELVQASEELPDAAATCPKIYFYGKPNVLYSTGGRLNSWAGTTRQVGRGEVDRGQFNRTAERDYADGACMLIKRAALERVGLLDEDYFAYWEETDWCARAADAGYRCYYVPTARVQHKAARSQSPDNDFYYLFRRNAFLFLRKRKSPAHLLSALLLYLFLTGPFHLLKHPTAVRRLPGEARAFLWHLASLFRPPGAAVRRT